MYFKISCMPHDDGTASLYFEHFGHWGNFDCIVKLLEQENNCVIHNNDELTNRRIAKLSWNNISFEVRHDIMLGNFLYTANKKDLSVLNKLAENVIKSVSYK